MGVNMRSEMDVSDKVAEHRLVILGRAVIHCDEVRCPCLGALITGRGNLRLRELIAAVETHRRDAGSDKP